MQRRLQQHLSPWAVAIAAMVGIERRSVRRSPIGWHRLREQYAKYREPPGVDRSARLRHPRCQARAMPPSAKPRPISPAATSTQGGMPSSSVIHPEPPAGARSGGDAAEPGLGLVDVDTSQWRAGSSTSSPSLTVSAGAYWPGGCRSRWRRTSASRPRRSAARFGSRYFQYRPSIARIYKS